jgi:RNA polymerase sigma-70 factor (ECF subfamily)
MSNAQNLPADAELPDDAHARFLRLFLQNEKALFRYVSTLAPTRADTDDIVQQTALALWREFGSYDAARPFEAWAITFARFETLAWLKKSARWRAFADEGLADMLWRRRAELDVDRRLAYLAGCVEKLPDEQRQLVQRYYLQNKTVEQLAELGGRTIAACYKALERARRLLQECVERTRLQEEAAA